MTAEEIATLENWQSALTITFFIFLILAVVRIIDTTKRDIKLRQKEYERDYQEDIENAYLDGVNDTEVFYQENCTVLPKRKRSEGRTDWIELPDEGACLQALPAPAGE